MFEASFPAKHWPLYSSRFFALALIAIFSLGCGSSPNDDDAVADRSASNKEPSAQIAKQPAQQPNPLDEETSEPAEEDADSNADSIAESTELLADNHIDPPERNTPLKPEGSSEDEEAGIENEEEAALTTEPEPSELSADPSLNTDGEQLFLLNGKQKQPDFSGEPQQPKHSKEDEWKVVIRESWKDYLPDLGLRYVNQRIEVVSTNPSKYEPLQIVMAGRGSFILEVPFEPTDSKLQAILKQLNEAGIELVNQVEHVVDGKPEPPFTLAADCSQLEREEALALLVNFPEIKRLTMIRNPNVTSAALSPISKLSHLEELYLARTAVGDEGIAKLSTLQSLKKLDLSQTDVTDASFPTFVQLTNLKTLGLTSTHLSEKLVKELKDKLLPECEIDFSSIDIPKDYSEIEEQPFVLKSRQGYFATTAIRFGGLGVTDARLMDLRSYTGLNVVCIDGTRVNGEGFRYLKQHKFLTCVLIRNSPFTDDGLKQLTEFRNLVYLVIEGGSMSDEGIEQFKKKKPDVELVLLD